MAADFSTLLYSDGNVRGRGGGLVPMGDSLFALRDGVVWRMHGFHEAKSNIVADEGYPVGFFPSVEVNLLMATYKCATCGAESTTAETCCGQPMQMKGM